MLNGTGKKRMNKTELKELMRLRGWTKTQLAAELGLTEHAVIRWLFGDREPSGPAAILMQMWLKESRNASMNEPDRRSSRRPALAAS